MAGARVACAVFASLLSRVKPGPPLSVEDATCASPAMSSVGERAPALLQVQWQRNTLSAAEAVSRHAEPSNSSDRRTPSVSLTQVAAWHCHEYADGQDDAWCQTSPLEAGFQFSFAGDAYQCGGCSCCKRETTKSLALKLEKVWVCHNYTAEQNDEWCRTEPSEAGFEYAFNGGYVNQCGGCWCCKRELPPNPPMKTQMGSDNVSFVSRGAGNHCALPEGAVWCEARLKNLTPFWMAVYDWDEAEDWVSYNICQTGYWEEQDMSEFGAPGHMLDIGGNIGFYSFALAQAGWNVTAFEPMPTNFALMSATLCRNPGLAGRVRLNSFGLGAKTHECKMMRPQGNVGDGFTRCSDEEAGTILQRDEDTFKEVGNFTIRRLDEVLLEQHITEVDLVKVDVEGHESQVFAGAPNFLKQYRPRLIKSEVWDTMVGSTGPTSGYEYLAMFESAGYKAFADNKCQTPINSKAEMDIKHALDVVYCM